jgi:hypothetical protein
MMTNFGKSMLICNFGKGRNEILILGGVLLVAFILWVMIRKCFHPDDWREGLLSRSQWDFVIKLSNGKPLKYRLECQATQVVNSFQMAEGFDKRDMIK